MNILRTATLVAIFIKCVTASGDLMSQFRGAVDQRDIDRALRVHQSSPRYSEGRKEMLNYVVDTKHQVFIFEFAKQADIEKDDLLAALHRKKSPKILEEAFKVLEFSQRDLIGAASQPELMCCPKDLVSILGRVENQKDQEEVIRDGVMTLLGSERAECLDPLFSAFKRNRSFRHLKEVAIKEAFKGGSFFDNKLIVERFYDDPEVSSEVYAWGLTYCGIRSAQDHIFNFLLGEADQDDLNAVKKNDWYEDRLYEFKKVIENTLLIAKPGGTRLTLPFQRAELVMKTFRRDPRMGIPTEISQLIGYYLADGSILKPRSMLLDTVTRILEDDDSGIRMATELSELIISYLVEELTRESITASVKKTIGIKRKGTKTFGNKNPRSAHKHARKKRKSQRHPTRE